MFDLQSAMKARGKGLANQMRRANAIGAEIRWTATATGTCLTLSLPIRRDPSSATDAVLQPT